MFVPEIKLYNQGQFESIEASIKTVSLENWFDRYYLKLQKFNGVAVFTYEIHFEHPEMERDESFDQWRQRVRDFTYDKASKVFNNLLRKGYFEGEFKSVVLIAKEEKE